MNHNFRLWFELWCKLWFGVWLKLWPKIEESSMISLRGDGLVAAFFWCARGDPGSRARPRGRGTRGQSQAGAFILRDCSKQMARRPIVDYFLARNHVLLIKAMEYQHFDRGFTNHKMFGFPTIMSFDICSKELSTMRNRFFILQKPEQLNFNELLF